MLIHFDVRCDEVLAGGDIATLTLSEVLRSHREGHHLVILERAACRDLLSKWRGNPIELATLRQLGHEFTQSSNLLSRAKYYIAIKAAGSAPRRLDARRVEIGFADLLSSKILERPRLIVENIQSDGKMLDLILKHSYRSRDIPPPSWQFDHGGGDDIVTVCSERVGQRYITFSIIDSDRSSPFDKGNDKLSRLQKALSSYAWPLIFSHQLPCRETENLITLGVFNQIPNIDKHALSDIQAIHEVESRTGCQVMDRFWLYFDIKNGLTEAALETIEPNATRAWIVDKLSLITQRKCWPKFAGHGGKIVDRATADNRTWTKPLRGSYFTGQILVV